MKLSAHANLSGTRQFKAGQAPCLPRLACGFRMESGCPPITPSNVRPETSLGGLEARPTLLRQCLLALLLVTADVIAQPVAPAPAAVAPVETSASLRERLTALVKQPHLAAAALGVKIVSLDTGKTLFEHEADGLLRPASNGKLFTGALALDRFGPNQRIRTSVYAAAKPDTNGVVAGDLILYGRGDFSFAARFNQGDTSKSLEPLVAALTNAGVRRVSGSLVGDESFFRAKPHGASWTLDDAQSYYGAEVSALTLEDNVIDLTVKPGTAVGEPLKISLKPATGFLVFSNRTQTVAQGGRRGVGFYRPLDGNVVYARGTLPLGDSGATDAITVHQPALFFVTQLQAALAERGIQVDGPPRMISRLDRDILPLNTNALVEIAASESRPMSELVRLTMKPSQNQYAQLLLLQAGRAAQNSDLPVSETEDAGIAQMKSFLAGAGVKAGEALLDEGSGLSRTALVTPDSIIQLLLHMARHRHAEAFIDALPIGGVDGTLRNRFLKTAAEKNVRAKTGSLSYVATLSGYVTTAGKERLAFSILLNNYAPSAGKPSARDVVDGIVVKLAEFNGRSE
jgi:D-alanyl-D-alanine carboxypeptidase/D-alanyl-D-alanine-endopeptidase (penicillin-binding protein 4)